MIVPRHIVGQCNVLADLASQVGQIVPSEGELAKEKFQWIIHQSLWGPSVIDAFAIVMSHQLPMYFSSCPDPKAMEQDALACR